jgi:5-methyltetrahydrofolate--homocysteine methyltransferase
MKARVPLADLPALAQSIIDGMADNAGRLTAEALAQSVPPARVLDDGLLAGMRVVGVRFRNAEMFLPDVLASARAMKTAMTLLDPALSACGVEPVATVLLGTVKGDIHDIGKNLVGVMLRGAGCRVLDLGTNVTGEQFAAAAAEHRPAIIGMSALLTTTMQQMSRNMEKFRAAGVLDRARVMVGGAAVTRQFAESIGAAYAKDAGDAVALALEMLHSREART